MSSTRPRFHIFNTFYFFFFNHFIGKGLHILYFQRIKISYWIFIFFTKIMQCTFQKEQEEIMETRPFTQKGLNLEEIKQMKYLSKVCYICEFFIFSYYYYYSSKIYSNIYDLQLDPHRHWSFRCHVMYMTIWIWNIIQTLKKKIKKNYALTWYIIFYVRLLMRCCAEQVSRLQTSDRQKLMSTSMVGYSISIYFTVLPCSWYFCSSIIITYNSLALKIKN